MPGSLTISLQCICSVLDQDTGFCPQCVLVYSHINGRHDIGKSSHLDFNVVNAQKLIGIL